MSDTTQNTELDVLKQRADMMGISYSPRISAEKLRERIREHRESLEEAEPVVQYSSVREQIYNEAMKLVRVRITNMNPKKKDLHGELITVANEFIGTVTKFIPFDPEFSANGYHIPNVIYQNIKEKKFLSIRTVRDRATGRNRVTESWAKEYAIEVLPPLTEAELRDLAVAQLASGTVGTESI